MRNPLLFTLLILLALIPIAIWAYVAYGFALSYLDAERGARKAGQAAAILLMILLALTPAFIGGVLMAVGAALLDRKPLVARVTATIGLTLIILTVAVFIAFEVKVAGHELLIAAAVYVVLHAGVIAWLWRGWRRQAV